MPMILYFLHPVLMLLICCDSYASDYNIIFNASKSKCIHFSPKGESVSDVYGVCHLMLIVSYYHQCAVVCLLLLFHFSLLYTSLARLRRSTT